MSKTNIYILKLEKGHYYVGKTDNVGKRFHEHMTGKGSSWTRKYKPISIEKSIPNCSPFDEDKYVKEYMAKYGINKVRGGSYVTEELDEIQKYSIQKEIWSAKNCCTRCGRNNHFVKSCFASTDVDGYVIDEYTDTDDSEDEYDSYSDDDILCPEDDITLYIDTN